MKISKRNLLWLIVLAVFGVILTGCAMNRETEIFPVQGDDEYGINFQLDYDVFDEGGYYYAPSDLYGGSARKPRKMGGIRSGYRRYYTLIMDFSFKDGRSFHEEVDIEALMRDLASREDIFDNRDTKWGGVTELEVTVDSGRLNIDYEVTERILEPKYKVFRYRYPLYRKALN